jgi:hypothetical protein
MPEGDGGTIDPDQLARVNGLMSISRDHSTGRFSVSARFFCATRRSCPGCRPPLGDRGL